MGDIIHSQLGTITPDRKYRLWSTQPLPIEGLGFQAPICAFTRGEPPTEAQLAAMINALAASDAMKQAMVQDMFQEYNNWRGNSVDHDLPELHEPGEIWKVFSELSIFIDDDSEISTTFGFRLEADPDHEMNVTFLNGKLVSVMIEG